MLLCSPSQCTQHILRPVAHTHSCNLITSATKFAGARDLLMLIQLNTEKSDAGQQSLVSWLVAQSAGQVVRVIALSLGPPPASSWSRASSNVVQIERNSFRHVQTENLLEGEGATKLSIKLNVGQVFARKVRA